MRSQTEGDMGRQSVQVKCVHRGALSEHLEQQMIWEPEPEPWGVRTVHQFWACFTEGLHFNWEGEVSHSSEVCPHTCLPRWEETLWESELSREDTERSSRWCSLIRHISPQGTASRQQRLKASLWWAGFPCKPRTFSFSWDPFQKKRTKNIFKLVKVWYFLFFFSKNLCIIYICISEGS